MRSATRVSIPAVAIAAVVALSGPRLAAAPTLAVCAPGYPSSTEQAQPVMDEFAAAVTAASHAASPIAAVYHPTLDAGLAALEDPSTSFAIVPLPFYLKYRERFDLEPKLEVIQSVGDLEVWSLVARRDALSGPPSLAGWKVEAISGYAPEFVRSLNLTDWGRIPEEIAIGFSSRVLSALRKAARGDKLAVLLDTGQAAALEGLPFAKDLAVVARSEPMIGTLLCRVGNRTGGPEDASLAAGMLAFDRTEAGRELLRTMRLSGFRELDRDALARLERSYGASPDATAAPDAHP